MNDDSSHVNTGLYNLYLHWIKLVNFLHKFSCSVAFCATQTRSCTYSEQFQAGWGHTTVTLLLIISLGFIDSVMHRCSYFICKQRTTNCFWWCRSRCWYYRLIEKACHRLTKLESEGCEFYDAWNRTSVDLVKAAKVKEHGWDVFVRDINVISRFIRLFIMCRLCCNFISIVMHWADFGIRNWCHYLSCCFLVGDAV